MEVAAGRLCMEMDRGEDILSVAFSPDGRFLATGGTDQRVVVWDVGNGSEVGRLEGHSGIIRSLAYSEDGKSLASSSSDTTAILWDATAATSGLDRRGKELSPSELRAMWTRLTGEDSSEAYRAIHDLAGGGVKVVPFLEAQLEPMPPEGPGRILQLIHDLDAEDYATREKAIVELKEEGVRIRPSLLDALGADPSPEKAARLRALLKAMESPLILPSGEVLRRVRTIHVLEMIGTTEARDLLRKIADQTHWRRVTRDTRTALERLEGRGGR